MENLLGRKGRFSFHSTFPPMKTGRGALYNNRVLVKWRYWISPRINNRGIRCNGITRGNRTNQFIPGVAFRNQPCAERPVLMELRVPPVSLSDQTFNRRINFHSTGPTQSHPFSSPPTVLDERSTNLHLITKKKREQLSRDNFSLEFGSVATTNGFPTIFEEGNGCDSSLSGGW